MGLRPLRDIRAAARAMHHVLVAHGKAVDVLRAAGQDNIGIYLNFEPAEPANGDDGDAEAALRYHAIYNEWFLGALFKKSYPRRALQGLRPHLPEGWEDDMEQIARPLDWLGVNFYTRKLIAHDAAQAWPSLKEVPGPLPKTDMDWEITPESFEWLLGWIAESHTSSEDGLTWDFKIRPGVKFHDGSDFTSADVLYSYNRIIKEKLSPSWRFSAVKSIKAPDDSTVVITVKSPSPSSS